MKIVYSIFCAFIVFFNVRGQEHFVFKPKWNIGEQKKIVTTNIETTVKDGEVISIDTIVLPSSIKVDRVDADYYYITRTYENIVMRTVVKEMESLGGVWPKAGSLTLQYSINKQTGVADLINWNETKDFIESQLVQLVSYASSKYPDAEDFLKLSIESVMSLLKDKPAVQSYFNDELTYFLAPFQESLSLKDTVYKYEKMPNPMYADDSIDVKWKGYIKEIKGNNLVEINFDSEVDVKQLLSGIKQAMMDMFVNMGLSKKDMEEGLKEFNQLEASFTDKTRVIFNTTSNWPLKIVTTNIISTSGKGDTDTFSSIRTTIIN